MASDELRRELNVLPACGWREAGEMNCVVARDDNINAGIDQDVGLRAENHIAVERVAVGGWNAGVARVRPELRGAEHELGSYYEILEIRLHLIEALKPSELSRTEKFSTNFVVSNFRNVNGALRRVHRDRPFSAGDCAFSILRVADEAQRSGIKKDSEHD